MRFRMSVFAMVCLVAGSGAQCLQFAQRDVPPGAVYARCARDNDLLIVDACSNCRAACDFTLSSRDFACNQCGQMFPGITHSSPNCGTTTHVSSGRFKIKEKEK